MEKELLARINNLENMNEKEFLFKVLMDLELAFPNNNVRVIESINKLISIRFGKFAVLLTLEDIEMLKDIEDPFALDRYLLAHFLKNGMTVDPKSSNYLKHIFGYYKGYENLYFDEDEEY